MITLEQDLIKLGNLKNAISCFEAYKDDRYTWRENRIHSRRSQKKLKRLIVVIDKKSNLIEKNNMEKGVNVTTTHYEVKVNDNSGSLSPTGYSKYHDRWEKKNKGKLLEEVYGYEQAKEHVQEYFDKKDEYTKNRSKDVLTIVKVITITETVSEHKVRF